MNKEQIKEFSESLAEAGFEYASKYVLKFGPDLMPAPFGQEKNEAKYKRCLEEGHPWDYYWELPPDDVIT